ncbi:MAG TPA: hypothetical protein VLF59_00900 [Candidatus Saccharimonadales bacterium]|nr:hypothetical protein [Candidatus Saccharimonadales bacterium]
MIFSLSTYFAAFDWSNPWLVGIGTAILSGLAVNYISRTLWSRRDDNEYRQKIDAANSEVLYALRPSVAEASMPTEAIIESLLRATARKYALKRESLMSLEEIADALIKEVMDSSFISHEQKVKYCTEIEAIKQTNYAAIVEEEALLGTADPFYAYRRKQRDEVATILSISAAAMALVTTLSGLKGGEFDLLSNSIPLIAVASTIPIIGTIVTYFFKTDKDGSTTGNSKRGAIKTKRNKKS